MPLDPWNPKLATWLKSFVYDLGFFVWLPLLFSFSLKKRKQRWAVWSLISLLALFASPLPVWIFQSWFSPTSSSQNPLCGDSSLPIVVLGGGVAAPDLPNIASQERLLKAVSLMESSPQRRLFVVSGLDTYFTPPTTESPYLRYLEKASASAYSQNEVLWENKSLDTRQNGFYTRELFESRKLPLKIWLVTSPWHLRRSSAVFKKLGFETCDIGTELHLRHRWVLFSAENAMMTRTLLNEMFGLIGYKLKGWI